MTDEKKQELAEKREQALIKRAKKSYHFRGGKNFIIWFVGVLFGIILLIGGIAAGAYLVPIKTYLNIAGVKNQDEYVSEEVGNESAVKAIMNIGTYKVSDIAFVANMLDDLVSQSGMDQILKIDVAKLKTVKLSELGNGLKSSIKLSKDLFGEDFSKLEIFKTVEVPEKDMPSSPLSSGDTAKLYYYLASGVYGESSAVYERAYTDDGTRVSASEGKTLYYLDIAEMTVEDLIDVIGPRFKLMGIKSVLETFGGADDNSMVVKILGDKNVGDIGSITAADIKLSDVVTVTDVRVQNLLSDVTNGKAFDEITVEDLGTLYTDNIGMKNVLGTISDELRSMLEEATGVSYEVMKLQDVKDITDEGIKSIKLASVIQLESTNGVYKILTSLLGDYNGITIGDLTEIELGDVLLKDVFDLSVDMKNIIEDMLVDGVTITSYEQVKLSAFENIALEQISKIKLSSVVSTLYVPDLYAMLEDITGIDRDLITIGDLDPFEKDDLHLASVLPISDNEKLYDILVDAIGGGKTPADITLADLSSADFDINKIKISTVIGASTGNKIIDKLCLDDTVTIGNIGEKTNALKLSDIIDVDVMKEVAVTSTYSSDDAIYTLSSNGVTYELVNGTFNAATKKYSYTGLNVAKTYYKINSDAGVWFLALTETTDSTSYSATSSEQGAYKTIKAIDGCTIGDLSSLTIDISVIKIKVLKDLNLLDTTVNGTAYDITIADLLAVA